MERTVPHKRLNYAIVVLSTLMCAALSSSVDTTIPWRTGPGDPHGCLLYEIPGEMKVFTCCDGYYKDISTNITENCIECPDGRYGSFCKKNCTCENGGTCNKRDGSCDCPGHYFGENCAFSCNCENDATCLTDGTCSCTNGFYGARCEFVCSCLPNNMCNSETGECVCQDGFSGPSCLPCNCSINERCDPFDGRCSCKPGYYGYSCEQKCTCFNGATCTNEDGTDCKCADGWTGSDCTVCDTAANEATFCEDRCLRCYNGDTCSISNSDCLCTPGWQGDRCDQKCDEGYYGTDCSQVCECMHGDCNHVTGTCQCKSGWTGHHCEQPCPDNCVICKDDTCMSCKPGWTGVSCTNPCKSGFYGDSCKQRCPVCYCAKTCYHISGDCPDVERCENGGKCIEDHFNCECPDEWSGPVCNISVDVKVTQPADHDVGDGIQTTLPSEVGFVSTRKKKRRSILIAILIGGVASIIALTIFIGTVVLTLKKKRRKRNADATVVATDEFQESKFLETLNECARNNNGVDIAESSQQPHSSGNTETSVAVNVDDETDDNPYDTPTISETGSPRMDGTGMTNAETENGENNPAITINDEMDDNPYDIPTNSEAGSPGISHQRRITADLKHGRKAVVAHRPATWNNFSPTTDEFYEGPYAIVPLSGLHFNLGSDKADNEYDKLDGLRYSKCQKQSHSSVKDKNGVEFERLPSTDDAGYDSLSNSQPCEESTCLSSTDETEYDKLESTSEKTQIM
ncbi:uncharacterized protein [Ptychodera flava]|uniref:uncharacterized protein n=1 Tax=Ptychodera flava TaxID=63121 RepID=UPI003969DEAC